MQNDLSQLNLLSRADARQEFLKCCGSDNWARRLAERLPFLNFAELLDASDDIWWSLEPAAWLAAFRSHPKIGERKAAAEVAEQARGWSESEQAGVQDAARETSQALSEGNRAYEERFGYIFIVCATGKTSAQMLAILGARLSNEPATELRVAAEEQRKITNLRLGKMILALR